jgi:capsular exopolysaccharide synthesis family protein
MDAINLRLNAELRTALDRLDTYHRMLLDKQKALNEKLPEFERRLAKYNSVKQHEELVKDSMVTWQNFISKLEKDHQTDLYALDRDRVSVTFGGVLQTNDLPISPNRFSLLIYTTIVGLMLALGVPFLVEYLDHTLSNLEQVESTFQIRGLGIVPKVESEDEPSFGLMGHAENKETNLLENFRVIRTNLLSMGALSKPPHVLMVTSAMPKEGKTVVSSNLALSFAQTGAKTLLLDTDLRRGRLHRLFGYRKQPGLSGVLLGQVTLEEALRPTHHENLTVLSTGQHIESGTELLGGQKFKDIMAELRQRFDRIVMDTPPVLGLSETSVLQNEVDGVLFVIWSGHTPIKSVRSAVEMLQANGANFYGFVLNRLDLSTTANYYQYYYYSHDYYYHYSPRALENA